MNNAVSRYVFANRACRWMPSPLIARQPSPSSRLAGSAPIAAWPRRVAVHALTSLLVGHQQLRERPRWSYRQRDSPLPQVNYVVSVISVVVRPSWIWGAVLHVLLHRMYGRIGVQACCRAGKCWFQKCQTFLPEFCLL